MGLEVRKSGQHPLVDAGHRGASRQSRDGGFFDPVQASAVWAEQHVERAG